MGYTENMGETPGGFLGILDPKIEECDPKKLKKYKEVDILENEIEYIDFQSWE